MIAANELEMEIDEAYEQHDNSLIVVMKRQQDLNEAKAKLKRSVAGAVFAGLFPAGKNEREHEANAIGNFSQLYADVDAREAELLQAECSLASAKLEIDRLKLLVKLMEVSNGSN